MILAIGECLDRRDGDRVAGVHAHRIEVFDRADHHAVVLAVAHDLHFVFLPTEQRFLDEDFGNRREVKAAGDDFLKLLAVVSDATALSAKREGRADDQWKATDFLSHLARFFHRVGGARKRQVEADLEHRLLETLAVFALVDRVGIRTDHAHLVLIERARLEERHRGVECRLAAESRQQGIGLLADDDFFHHFRRDRLDVSAMGKLRIGHDCCRIGVHQNDFVALFLERLAGLDAGVVELTALADDDRAGADDENFADRGVFGHGGCVWAALRWRVNWAVCGRESAACKGWDCFSSQFSGSGGRRGASGLKSGGSVSWNSGCIDPPSPGPPRGMRA